MRIVTIERIRFGASNTPRIAKKSTSRSMVSLPQSLTPFYRIEHPSQNRYNASFSADVNFMRASARVRRDQSVQGKFQKLPSIGALKVA